MKRIKSIGIDRTWIEDLCNVDYIIMKNGTLMKMELWPDGSKIVGMYVDHLRDGIMLLIEHESFDEVLEGAEVPLAYYEIETKYSRIVRTVD